MKHEEQQGFVFCWLKDPASSLDFSFVKCLNELSQ